ncbi:unnamed protein product [Cylindrotheca closterium]|uniref:ubiquitinyl hydrolase 1 n=1 Tax=Cylindrotheca closterium TaxID=2856 RepID=A0AAD2FIJ0_9STRA|nr:unnamed protein product [Cylindrotheca closterium]
MSEQWSLCLQSRQGRKIVKITDTATTEELFQLATETFQTPVLTLKYGFPPKGLEKGSISIKDIIQNQERLQVEFDTTANSEPTGKAKAKGKGKGKGKGKISTAPEVPEVDITNSGRRSKRAAAKAATEAMPAVIKAQDEMMNKASAPSKKRPRPTTKPSGNKTSSRPNFGASVGDGRRLADGATVVNPKKSRAKKNILQASGSGDMSEALLGALNNKGKMGSVLRKGMKNAVGKSYETTRAFSRLAAIQNQSYQLVVQENQIGGESNNGKLTITYKGTVDKSIQMDTVDCIPRDILEAVIQGIHASNEDALRVENLALLSPRVLWSLVHAFPNTPDVTDCYKQLLPNLDWSFLRRRAQQLSEKAMENLRQDQESKGEGAMDAGKAQDAIAAVEHAMEHLQEHEKVERSSRQARAALARMQQHDASSTWKLVTPDEIDRDELRECIQAAPPDNPDKISSIITHMIKTCQIHNWRELANVPEDIKTRLPTIADKFQEFGTTPNEVSKWVDKAQEESVDEIIVDICDGNVPAVEILTEQARTGTPKDLANWRLIPEALHSELNDKNDNKPTIEQLATWSKRAHDSLEEHEWLSWYATPVG